MTEDTCQVCMKDEPAPLAVERLQFKLTVESEYEYDGALVVDESGNTVAVTKPVCEHCYQISVDMDQRNSAGSQDERSDA